MIYVLLSISLIAVLAAGVAGYFTGRYQANLLAKIQALQSKQAEPAPEPEKPTVAGGAYMPPREISTTPDKKKAAGIVEAKTPELMEWEARQEMAKLEQGA